MATPNNNLNILPFYDSVEKQNHRKTYAFNQTFNLISENVRILPFQFRRNREDAYIQETAVMTEGAINDLGQTLSTPGYFRTSVTNNAVMFQYSGGSLFYSGEIQDSGLAGVAYFDEIGNFISSEFTALLTYLNVPMSIPVNTKFIGACSFGSEPKINSLGVLNKVNFINLESGEIKDILNESILAGLGVLEFSSEGYDLVINPSLLILPSTTLNLGNHYLEIGDTAGNVFFSEVFNVVQNVNSYLKISYWDEANFIHTDGHIDYSIPYKNYVYLPTEIGKPEYPFEEQAQKRDGYTFIEKQISEKKYKFTFIAPEFLCDALRIVRMHDHIEINSKGETYNVENIIFDPKWKDQGDLAVIETEFECDTVMKKIGKSISASGGSGSFNNDFNNDFNNN